jgi:hypothetical protein
MNRELVLDELCNESGKKWLDSYCICRQANIFFQIRCDMVAKLEEERASDFLWILLRCQPAFRDFFVLPHADVKHLLTEGTKTPWVYEKDGRFRGYRWLLSIQEVDSRYRLQNQTYSNELFVDITQFRNDLSRVDPIVRLVRSRRSKEVPDTF